MRDKEFNIACDNCETEFTIITAHSEDDPTSCPFCGSDLSIKDEDDDEADEE